MPDRSAICLVIDRLPAHLVGAYGNAWIQTPALNALAAQSLVCDFATIDSPKLSSLYRSYWQGVHAAIPQSGFPRDNPLVARLRSAGKHTQLLTDEFMVAQVAGARHFDKEVELNAVQDAETAASVAETGLGMFFGAAAEAVERLPSGSLLWLHCRGLGGPWDAPVKLRHLYAAEEDPSPPDSTRVPCEVLLPDHDPDYRLGISQAAAGQVTALDECLEMFLGTLAQSANADNTLLIVIGGRGLPLGEHLTVGALDGPLYEELIHVPLLVRLPGGGAIPRRTGALVQPADVFATLLDWFGVEEESTGSSPPLGGASLLALAADPRQAIRDRAVTIGAVDSGAGSEWSIRTPAWYLRRSLSDNAEQLELYVKPDDRFEQNNVARRCGDMVERLAAAANDFLHAAQASGANAKEAAPLPPLDAVLVEGLG
ncbi:MAG: sulfatase-like hydrolase/transferase [Planctomycetia bacterium]|nr:sulfatase-like hydrolase/transferase [Planctomycetia bacterium]